MKSTLLADFFTVSFNHKRCDLSLIGSLHIEPDLQQTVLPALKLHTGVDELMYVSTCNRVEYLIKINPELWDLRTFINHILPHKTADQLATYLEQADVFQGEAAVKHLLKVTASLDSVVVGEREIIAQVRKAFESCRSMGLTGDLIRLVMRCNIEAAKTVFTDTAVFKKPVSVVSLAFHALRDMRLPRDSRVVLIGAGKTNRAMAKFLAKHGMKNMAIFNRTFEKAKLLAEEIGVKAYPLDELMHYNEGADVVITCTASGQSLIGEAQLKQLINGDSGTKLFIDLAVPGDIDTDALSSVANKYRHIDIAELKEIAQVNLSQRQQEIEKCEAILDKYLLEFHDTLQQREVERAMSHIPEKVKEIKDKAVNEVYAKELHALDPESRALLERIIDYMEKKYISVPMRMAKEVMLSKK